MDITFTEIRKRDLKFVLEVLNYYIVNTTASYYTQPVTLDVVKHSLPLKHPKYKSYIIWCDGEKAGYCYLTQFNRRQAYDRTSEVSLYLKSDFTGKGIGSMALRFLEEKARPQNIHNLISLISGDNRSSIRLFEKNGYEKCAHYRQVGEKFGKLLDLVVYQKMI